MSTQVDQEPVLVLDGKKYIIDDLSDTAKYLLRNIDDVQQQLNSHQMKIDQLNMSKEGLTTRLKSEVEPTEKTEVEEKEEGS